MPDNPAVQPPKAPRQPTPDWMWVLCEFGSMPLVLLIYFGCARIYGTRLPGEQAESLGTIMIAPPLLCLLLASRLLDGLFARFLFGACMGIAVDIVICIVYFHLSLGQY